jgi:cytochrome c biogenesis protein CcmG, thiol:disulfide interchange protein DsbE
MRSEQLTPARPGRRAFLRSALSGWLAASVWRSQTAHANDLRVGSAAPPATLVTLEGKSISTGDLVGQVVILTFWATWCVPCREELPLLSGYATKHAPKGLAVLGFSLDTPDRLADVRKVADQVRFPVGFLASSRAPGYGRIWRLPVNFTIDRAGRLVEDGWKEKAPSWTAERLEQLVTPLLG